MKKTENFDVELQEMAVFAKVLSNPARLAILHYLAEARTCISGDITDYIPLSRTTVSQHLKELRDARLIHGEIDGLKINYCLCGSSLDELKKRFEDFFAKMETTDFVCSPNK